MLTFLNYSGILGFPFKIQVWGCFWTRRCVVAKLGSRVQGYSDPAAEFRNEHAGFRMAATWIGAGHNAMILIWELPV
jgi:hypothetical protein